MVAVVVVLVVVTQFSRTPIERSNLDARLDEIGPSLTGASFAPLAVS